MPGRKASPETWNEQSLSGDAFCPLMVYQWKEGEQNECKMGLQGATSKGHTYMKEKLKANYGYSSACGSNLSFKDDVPVSNQ